MGASGARSSKAEAGVGAENAALRSELCRLEAEIARLRASEKMYRISAEIGRRLVWRANPEGGLIDISPLFSTMTGIPRDRLMAGAWIEAIHPDDRERFLECRARSLRTGEDLLVEFRILQADGMARLALARAVADRDEAGAIQCWYGTTEDIHEEMLASQAQRDAEHRYRLAVQAANDAVWDYDVENDMLDWSDNSAELFGSPDDPIGQTRLAWWVNRLHPDDRTRVYESFSGAIEGTQTHWSASYRFRRVDGAYADILDRGFIIRDPDGKPRRAVGAMADVTERNRAEQEILRMQAELIHVSRLSAMGAMASTLAHELNQPLAAVSNFISGARRLAAGEPTPNPGLMAALESASSGAQRAGEIVRRLRELVSRGTVSVTVEDLPRLIEEASVLGFVDEKPRGIRHRLDLDPAARWVHADRIQIQQVLINLIRNAIDAMEHSDDREVVVCTRACGDMVEIEVADTGTGIKPELFATLFSRFMTTKSGGMGIGLPISRTIVELHGGKIWAENRSDGGAVFRFTLPMARDTTQKPS